MDARQENHIQKSTAAAATARPPGIGSAGQHQYDDLELDRRRCGKAKAGPTGKAPNPDRSCSSLASLSRSSALAGGSHDGPSDLPIPKRRKLTTNAVPSPSMILPSTPWTSTTKSTSSSKNTSSSTARPPGCGPDGHREAEVQHPPAQRVSVHGWTFAL